MDGERFGELRTLGPLLGGLGCLCSPLQFAVLLRVTVLNVLQQVGLLHVEKWTVRAGEDLGGHLHSSTYAKHRQYSDIYSKGIFMVLSNMLVLEAPLKWKREKEINNNQHIYFTLRSKVLKAFVVLQKRFKIIRAGEHLPAVL